jgi:hypothetical protein
MKLFAPVSIGVLSLLLGAPALICAQDDAKPKQDEPKAQDQAKPPQGDEDRPKDMKPRTDDMKPQDAKPDDNLKPPKDESKPAKDAAKPQDHPEQNAGAAHAQSGHIPDDKFRAHFGRSHTVVINQPVIVAGQPRFQSGGYWFIISDPWPTGWAYTDTCYVDYVDGEYFLFDLLHPGVRIALVVVM